LCYTGLKDHGEWMNVMVHSSCHGEADNRADCSLFVWLCDEISQWNRSALP